MKYTLLLFIIGCFFCADLSGQQDLSIDRTLLMPRMEEALIGSHDDQEHGRCGTLPISVAEMQAIREQIAALGHTKSDGITYVPIKIHFVRPDNGDSSWEPTPTELARMIARSSNELYGSNMMFYTCGPVEIINDSEFHLFDESAGASMNDLIAVSNPVDDALNMYFAETVRNGDGDRLGGFAYYPFDGLLSTTSIMAMDNGFNWINYVTIPHELGHNFSLPHTFQNTSSGPFAADAENVARTGADANCETAGDMFCGTPSDPNDGDSSCMYTGGSTDRFGVSYEPSMTNIMSYYGGCVEDFSADQEAAMDAVREIRANYSEVNLNCTGDVVTMPVDLTASFNGNAVELAWTDLASNETGYLIERASPASPGAFITLGEGGVAANVEQFSDDTAVPGNEYLYRIRPLNGSPVTNGYSNTACTDDNNCNLAVTCDDGIQNGDETGIDCGGGSCPACSTCPASGPVFVTNVNDSGAGSLREAINCANANPDLDDIRFNLPGSAPFRISLETALPSITDEGINISLEGFLSSSFGSIILDGQSLDCCASGLEISSNAAFVEGLWIENFPDQGISISGNEALIGSQSHPIIVVGSGQNGMLVTGTSVTIENCYLGTDFDTPGIGNEVNGLLGIAAEDLTVNSCLIGYNGNAGIVLEGGDAADPFTATLTNNHIGTTGNADFFPNNVFGVVLREGARNVMIGTPNNPNIIGNHTVGIDLGGIEANNAVHNLFYCNQAPILGGSTPAAATPVINSWAGLTVSGTATAGTIVWLYEFSGFSCAPGFSVCQGDRILNSGLTDAGGNWSITLTEQPVATEITALAASTASLNSSEFSSCISQELVCGDGLTCAETINLSLNDECQQLLTLDDILSGGFGCLTENDFTINVNDADPSNGPIVDGAGSFNYTLTCTGPNCATAEFASCSGTLNVAIGDCATCDDGIQNGQETGVDCGGPDCPACPDVCDDFTVSADLAFSPAVICPGEETDVVITVSSNGVFPLNAILSGPGFPATTFNFPIAGEQRLTFTPTVAGTYTIANFTDQNGCAFAEGATGSITFLPLIDFPTVTCGTTTLNSVTINYDVNPDVQQYQLRVNGGAIITTDGGTFTASGLPPDTDVEFVLTAVGPCNANSISLTCRTDAAPVTCADGIQNGQETGIDCGGPECIPCIIPCEDTDFTYDLTVSESEICVGDEVNISFNVDGIGNPPFVLTVSEPGVAPYELTVADADNDVIIMRTPTVSGSYRINSVVDAEGCERDIPAEVQVEVFPETIPPTVFCGEATTSSVTLEWIPESLGTVYELEVNFSGQFPVVGDFFTVSDLLPGETVEFTLSTTGSFPCEDQSVIIDCTTLLDECAGQEPDVFPPSTTQLCAYDGVVDLTIIDAELSGGTAGVTVLWFEDDAGALAIADPTSFAPAAAPTTLYAQTFAAPCTSEYLAVTFTIEEAEMPQFDQLPTQLCANGGTYFLPEPTDGATGAWTLIGTGVVTSINLNDFAGQTIELAFDPNPEFCAISLLHNIEVMELITPLFANLVTTICISERFYDLPETDDNGLGGFWSITDDGSTPVNSRLDISDFAGQSLTYYFIPNNTCSEPYVLTFSVVAPIEVDFFTASDTICIDSLLAIVYTGADAGAGEVVWSIEPEPVTPPGTDLNPILSWDTEGEVTIGLILNNGCVANIFRRIYVKDCSDCSEEPIFTFCPPDREVLLDLGAGPGVDVSWAAPQAEACDTTFDFSNDTFIGGLMADTTLTFEATLGSGVSASCSFTIEVIRTDTMSFYVDPEGIWMMEEDLFMVPIGVINFDRGEGFQLPLALQDMNGAGVFTGDVMPVHPLLENGLDAALVSEQSLNLVWLTADPGPNTFPDSTLLFEVAVRLSGDPGACTQLAFLRELPEVTMAFRDGAEVFPTTFSGEVCLPAFASIAGIITKADETIVEGVPVSITREDGNEDVITDANGAYVLPEQRQGDRYRITPDLDGDDLNGISILDLVQIRNMVNGFINLSSPTTPYQYVAANVEPGDCIVDVFDLLTTMQLLSGNIDSFPGVPSWRFVPKAHPFPSVEAIRNGDTDWCDFPESIVVDPLSADLTDGDFVAMKMGDINLNAADPALVGNRSVTFTDHNFEPGDTLMISPGIAGDLAAAEMHWAYNATALRPVRLNDERKAYVESSDLVTDDGKTLRQVWSDLTGAPRLYFIARTTGRLEDHLTLRNDSRGADTDGNLYVLQSALQTADGAAAWSVLVSPNPFRETIKVSITSKQSSDATIAVFDMAGRMMAEQKIDLIPGISTAQIDGASWPVGVYYLRVAGAGGEQWERVVRQ